MVKQDTNFLLVSKHPIMNMSMNRLLNMVTSMVLTRAVSLWEVKYLQDRPHATAVLHLSSIHVVTLFQFIRLLFITCREEKEQTESD